MSSVTTIPQGAKQGAFAAFATLVRLGLRELRGGLSGFKIFIACLALGVMVIAAVGALADALTAGFERQGRTILGGDLVFARMHARAEPAERSAFDALGRTSETASMRTMARRLDGNEQALIELKAVDAAYPLVGAVTLGGDGNFGAAMTANGAVADAMLLERLGVKAGESIRIGEAEVVVKGVLKSEPDGIADRLTYGPRVFVSLPTFEKSGLLETGGAGSLALRDRPGKCGKRQSRSTEILAPGCSEATARSRLFGARPEQPVAPGGAHARSFTAVPHPDRARLAARRRHRRRQCGRNVHRQASQGHRHAAQRRRHGKADHRLVPGADPGHELSSASPSDSVSACSSRG